MDFSYITASEIKAIRQRMGLNYTQFGKAVGVKGQSIVKKWEDAECKPTGDRYERLLLLKKQILGGTVTTRSERHQTEKHHTEMPLNTNKKGEFEAIYSCYETYNSLSDNGKAFFKQLIWGA